MYSIMESLRKEIEQEMKRTRLDKARLYDLLLKIIDNCGSKAPAPVAKAPETAPVAKAPETAPVAKAPPKTTTVTKKVPVKKKVVTA